MLIASFWLATFLLRRTITASVLDDFFHFRLSLSPEVASAEGFSNYDHRVSARGLQASFALGDACRIFAQRASAEATIELEPVRRRYLLLVTRDAGECARAFRTHKCFLFPEANYLEMPSSLAASFVSLRPATESQYRSALRRLRGVAAHVEGIAELMEAGSYSNNVTYAAISLANVAQQVNSLMVRDIVYGYHKTPFAIPIPQAGHPESSPFFAPFEFLSQVVPSDEVRSRIREDARRAVALEVQPAYARLADVLSKYRPRPSPGISAVSGGLSMYEAALAYYTSIQEASPERIHEMGQVKVSELQQDVLRVARDELGWSMASAAEVFSAARATPGQTYSSPGELIAHAKKMLRERLAPMMKDIFPAEYLQDLDVPVILGPAHSGPPLYYRSGALHGGGHFVVANENPARLPKRFELPTMAAHEGLPGHAFQVGRFAPSLPPFLRLRATAASRASAPCR